MASELTRRFMEALQEAERTGDIDPLVELFADDAELSDLGGTEPCHGKAGAVRFWRDYLGVFQQIHSTFTLVLEGDGATALEWVSEGDLPGGHPIRYAGVSALETHGGRIRKFRAYYDPTAFTTPGAPVM
jgi:ketosteroid isomerase-like protein